MPARAVARAKVTNVRPGDGHGTDRPMKPKAGDSANNGSGERPAAGADARAADSHGGHSHAHGAHGHSHGHSHAHGDDDQHDHDDATEAAALTQAVSVAQSGLKRDVQALLDALSTGVLLVPLAEHIPGATPGEEVEIEEELSFSPHMLVGEDGHVFAAAFTEPAFAQEVAEALGWKTGEDDLEFVFLPALVAIDLSQADLSDERLRGVAINPGTEVELVLSRDEAASLVQGTALPLVGYVDRLPEGAEAATQVVSGAEPPPEELLAVLERARAVEPAILALDVKTTFNPERDREPHLTLFLTIAEGGERESIAQNLAELASPHLPPPGYLDVVFR